MNWSPPGANRGIQGGEVAVRNYNPHVAMGSRFTQGALGVLDALRGAALFGIIAANMRAFNVPSVAYMDHTLMWTGAADRIAQGLIDLLVSASINPVLLPVRIGFAIQMERADARGLQHRYFYLRRLTVMLAFGLLHGILLWWGDILAPYGDHGFRTLPFPPLVPAEDSLVGRRAYLYPLAITAGMVGLKGAGPGNDGLAAYQREGNGAHHRHLQRWSISPSSGRSRRVALQLLRTRFLLPPVSSAFSFRAFGSGREGILRGLKRTSGHATHVCARHGLWIGLLLNAAFVAVPRLPPQSDESPTVGGLCRCLFMSLGNPVLSLCYASTIALLWQEKRWRAAHERLRRRWANPRYRTSSCRPVLCTHALLQLGLRSLRQSGPQVALIPTLVIYMLQVWLSLWWTARFEYGPMEWCWRR